MIRITKSSQNDKLWDSNRLIIYFIFI